MSKVIKYMKPFIGSLIIAILLLYGQAMADLALPDYMSNIVNIGIQQGGVDQVLPAVIVEEDFEHLKMFLTEDEGNLLQEAYAKVNTTDAGYDDKISDYPKANGKSIYAIKELNAEETEALELPVAKALLSVKGVEKMMEDAGNEGIKIGERTLPAGTDLFALMTKLPKAQIDEMTADSEKRFEEMGDKMVLQAGAKSVNDYYVKLGVDSEDLQRSYILRMGGLMLLITLAGAAASIAVSFISARVAAGYGRDLRKAVFEKVTQFSNVELDKFSTSSLITRSTNDVTQIQNLMVIMIRMVFYAPIIGIGGVLKAMEKSSHMSWIIAVAVATLMILIGIVFVIAMPKFKMVQKLVDRLNLVTRESLAGMMVIRAFNTQAFEEERFDQANKDVTDTNLFVNRVMAFMFPMMMLIMNGTSLLIVWVGAHQIADASMQVGDMMAFMQYAMQIIFAFLMLSMMFIMIPRASVSAQRIAEVLSTELVIKEAESPEELPKSAKGKVIFDNVSFRYPGAEEDMIKNVSFVADAGKTTAIIGATGSGKTTLINLIPRFYDVSSGKIFMDGKDTRTLSTKTLRSVIGYVPQKASLFSGTIESNLFFANEKASQKDLETAAEVAQALTFINEKPEGFQSEIAQGGGNVSGGQKQRLSIARALVKKPKVYIFDDSFSALDFKTDAALRRALNAHTGESTMLIVAQRISTIKNADQIIVLEDGRMVGCGTHHELMQSCQTYQEIALSQLSKEELS